MSDIRNAANEATKWFVSQQRWPNSTMYHYTTSKEALQNILSSRRMWATDLRAMNDPREMLHGRELIDQRMKAAARHTNEMKATFLRTVHHLFTSLMAKRSRCFSISFSEHPDLPHQWRDYANDGYGFVLDWSIDSVCPEVPLRSWVTYDKATQKELVDGLIDFHFNWIGEVVSADSRQPLAALEEAGLSLARFLEISMMTFKGPKWSVESEFRYVYRFFQGNEPPNQVFKSRFAQGVEKAYIEADFGAVDLRRVIMGPRNDPESTARWLRQLLDDSGYRNTPISLPEVSVDEVESAQHRT